MRINVSKLMSDKSLGGGTFTRKRPTTVLANYGLAASSYTPATLTGIVQAAATADAQLLPEGVRLSDIQAFFTAGEISPGDGVTTLPDLLVDASGAEYRVLHVQDFGQHGMVKALAQRIYPGATT
jgi:hypothetical protein